MTAYPASSQPSEAGQHEAAILQREHFQEFDKHYARRKKESAPSSIAQAAKPASSA
jgi:hypothetical protein